VLIYILILSSFMFVISLLAYIGHMMVSFLAGLCTNLTCPYRHVNVNPKALVCEGFLRGYCADGDEVFLSLPKL
jgi:hypothetical protein